MTQNGNLESVFSDALSQAMKNVFQGVGRKETDTILQDSAATMLRAFMQGLLEQSMAQPVADKNGLSGLVQGAASFGEGLSVQVINNTPFSVQAQEKTNAQGKRELEIMIDQMVANAMLNGKTTTTVMGSVFGILPNLIKR